MAAALRADLERQHDQLRIQVIFWDPSLYFYNERLTRMRWGW